MTKMIRLLLALTVISTFSATGSGAMEIGDKAADFTAQSTQGEITLSDLAGKNVVLAFYYAAFTPV